MDLNAIKDSVKWYFETKVSELKGMSWGGSGWPSMDFSKIKKHLWTITAVFFIVASVVYFWSAIINTSQYKIIDKSIQEVKTTKQSVLKYKEELNKGMDIDTEKITINDYLFFLTNRLREINPQIRFSDVDKSKGNDTVKFTLKYLKYINIEEVLKSLRYGKTFLKIDKVELEYKYLRELDIYYYSMTIEGTLKRMNWDFNQFGEKVWSWITNTGITNQVKTSIGWITK